MAIAIDSSGHGNNGAGATTVACTFTVGSGANRYMTIVVAMRNAAATVSSIDVGGSAATQVTSARKQGSLSSVDRWYIKSPSSGSVTVTATLSASSIAAIGCISFSGVDQTTPHGTAATATATSAAPSVTVTSAVGEIAVGAFSQKWGSTTVITAGSGGTKQWEENAVSSSLNAADSTESGAASVVMDWTTGSNSQEWNATGLSIKPATSVAVTPTLALLGVGT